MKSRGSLKQRREALFQAARVLRDSPFWSAPSRTLFALLDPATGEAGYCTLTRFENEGLSFTLFRGFAALELYERILNGELSTLDFEYLSERSCLQLLYSPAREDPPEESVAPSFKQEEDSHSYFVRSCRPGHLPWKADSREIAFLTHALQLASRVLENHGTKELRFTNVESPVLLFTPRSGRGPRRWEESCVVPARISLREIEEHLDEIRLYRIKRKMKLQRKVWLGDFFYIPAPRQGEDAPYFPMVFLWVEEKVDHILSSSLTEPDRYRGEFRSEFLSLIESVNYLPGLVLVKRPELYTLLLPLARFLGFTLEFRSHLPLLDSQKGYFFDFSAQ